MSETHVCLFALAKYTRRKHFVLTVSLTTYLMNFKNILLINKIILKSKVN